MEVRSSTIANGLEPSKKKIRMNSHTTKQALVWKLPNALLINVLLFASPDYRDKLERIQWCTILVRVFMPHSIHTKRCVQLSDGYALPLVDVVALRWCATFLGNTSIRLAEGIR